MRTLLFALMACACHSCVWAKEFLSSPPLLSELEIAEGLSKKSLDMRFQVGAHHYFHFFASLNEIYFEETFSENAPNTPYLICERRIIAHPKPLAMQEETLASVLRAKNVMFYTGAGISAASNVPMMHQLLTLLQLETGENILPSLRAALDNPEALKEHIKIFRDACLFSAPTKAHFALKTLSLLKNAQIVTENLDYLHEYSGILPYRVDPSHLKSEIDPCSLCSIDYIICIGLSHDDRGFLGWYKEHNPQGKIISIDLGLPSYLGEEDYLLKGDLQVVVPRLLEAISTSNEVTWRTPFHDTSFSWGWESGQTRIASM